MPDALTDKSMEPADSTLQLQSVTPDPEETVEKGTVLTAVLAYQIKGFEAGQFVIFAQFNTMSDGATTDGTFNRYPVPMAQSGSLRFCFPLSDVWNDPGVARPLIVRFYLGHQEGSNRVVVVAQSKTLIYRTDGAP